VAFLFKMQNFSLSRLQKFRSFIIIFGVLSLIFITLFVFSALTKKEEPQPKQPSQQSDLRPQTKFEDKKQGIRIDYSPGTKAYWVYIDASSVQEYSQKRKEAVVQLREMNIDTCNSKTTFWPIPANIKTKFTANDLKALREITCLK